MQTCIVRVLTLRRKSGTKLRTHCSRTTCWCLMRRSLRCRCASYLDLCLSRHISHLHLFGLFKCCQSSYTMQQMGYNNVLLTLALLDKHHSNYSPGDYGWFIAYAPWHIFATTTINSKRKTRLHPRLAQQILPRCHPYHPPQPSPSKLAHHAILS